MNIDKLYDCLSNQLADVKVGLSSDQVDTIAGHINLACAEARTSTAASGALSELSSHIEKNLTSLPDIRDILKAGLRPWIELQKLYDEFKTAAEKVSEAEHSGKSGDGAIATLVDLTKRVEEIREKIATAEAILVPPEVLGAQACAGLRNRSNRCFIHATLKVLWASRAFRKLVTTKAKKETPRTALLLDRLFQKLDVTPASKVLEPDDEAIHSLLIELGERYPQMLDGTQHDASEFLGCIFTDLLAKDEHLFSYSVSKKRPPELAGDFVIPTIDLKEHVEGTIFLVNLPDLEGARVELQEALTISTVPEVVDPEAVLTSDRNADKNLGEIMKVLEKAPREVRVERSVEFSAPPPPCLLVQLVPAARQVPDVDPKLKDLKPEEKAVIEADAPKKSLKVSVRMHVPRTLTIKTEDGKTPRYALKGIVIHKGEQRSGHYFAILPEEAPSEDSDQFISHNDEAVSRVLGPDGALLDLEQNGYLLIYDLS